MTDGEVKVYLALLKLGATTIGPMLEQSRVTKSIIYRILERLIDKGLVSYVIKGRTKYFQAAPPHALLDYVEKREQELSSTKTEIRDLLPKLTTIQALTTLNQATIYEGFNGIVTAYKKRFAKLSAGDEYLNIGLPAEQPPHHHAFWQKDHAERVKRKIHAKLLYDTRVSDAVLRNRNSFWGCDARRMPTDMETPSWVLLYKDVVLIAIPQGEHPLAIEIVNREIAESFQRYFYQFWEKSKPFRK